MSEGQGVDVKHIKICLLGGQKVGKTYLAHKLVDRQYQSYKHVPECQKFLKNLEDKHQILMYYDFPMINTNLVEEITHDHKYDIMVCLFKDSTSFGQLYQFLEFISIKSQQNDEIFNQYWQSIKFIILVYSDYEQKGKVQIQELFSILSEQIRNFNRSATIKEFVLKSNLSNYQYLRNLIENNRSVGFISEDLTASEKETTKNQEELKRSKQSKSKRLSYSKQYNSIKIRDFSKSFNVDPQSFEKTGEHNCLQDENIEVIDINYINRRKQSPQIPSKAHQQIKEMELVMIQQEYKEPEQSKEVPPSEEIQQIKVQKQHQPHHEQKETIQVHKKEVEKTEQQLRELNKLHEKQKEHYNSILNKLLQKINNEDIVPSTKASYQDLFEQFRKTSKDDSKISQQMHDYWQEKLQKLQEQDQIDDDEDNEEEGVAPVQRKSEEHAIELEQRQQHKLLKDQPKHPQSNYLDGGRPKRQKLVVESKSCACIIM